MDQNSGTDRPLGSDVSGQHAHKIEIRDRTANQLEEILSPDDKVILRCMDCQEFYLPKEIHVLRRPNRDSFGRRTWDIIGLCPGCHPQPYLYKDGLVHASTFIEMTRAMFELTRNAEKAGLIYEPSL